MKSLSHLPVKAKLASATSVLVALISLFIFLYFPQSVKRQELRAIMDKSQSIAEMTAYTVSPALVFDDRAAAEEVLMSVQQIKGVVYTYVLDDSGHVFAAFNKNQADNIAFLSSSDGIRMSEDGKLCETMTRIQHNGRTIGELHLGTSLVAVKTEISRAQETIALVSLLVFALGMLVAVGISTVITRPLDRMVSTVKRISHGDLTQRAPVSNQDEVGHLAESFNLMVDNLESAHRTLESVNQGLEVRTRELQQEINERQDIEQALRTAHDELELRVQERTSELTHANAILKDEITERTRMEEELRKLFRAVEQSPVSVVIADTSGSIEYVNPKFTEVTGYTFTEAFGKNPRILKSGETPPDEYERLWKTITSGGQWSGEFHNKRKNGELYWELATISPIRNPEGAITHYLAVKEDITDRKNLEAQFRHTQRLEIIGTLAGGIAHDLNNVLAPILMAIDMFRRKLQDEKDQKILQTMEASARRGADIVKQVLTFARGAEGERILLQPKHLLYEIERIVGETFPRGIDVRSEVSKELWQVFGDATQLHQVLMNLCVNARDAMPKGGKLRLHAENIVVGETEVRMHPEAKNGPYVLITVEDTGAGIPAEIIDKIFDPFFTTKEAGKGTGLGLSTVLGIVRAHDGFITVSSGVGTGTRFRVYLPAESSAFAQIPQPPLQPPPCGNGELVLVVDDEGSIREVTKHTLELFGYRVLTASGGEESIDLYERYKGEIKVVLTDMMMPHMDGAAVVRALQARDRSLKFILVSGLTDSRDLDMGRTKVNALLYKPYKAEQLLSVLHSVLE